MLTFFSLLSYFRKHRFKGVLHGDYSLNPFLFINYRNNREIIFVKNLGDLLNVRVDLNPDDIAPHDFANQLLGRSR